MLGPHPDGDPVARPALAALSLAADLSFVIANDGRGTMVRAEYAVPGSVRFVTLVEDGDIRTGLAAVVDRPAVDICAQDRPIHLNVRTFAPADRGFAGPDSRPERDVTAQAHVDFPLSLRRAVL